MLVLLLGFAAAARGSERFRRMNFGNTVKSRYTTRRAHRQSHTSHVLDNKLKQLEMSYNNGFTGFLGNLAFAAQYEDMLNGEPEAINGALQGAYLPIVVPQSMEASKMWQFSDAQKKEVLQSPIFGLAAYPLFPEDDTD